jgi:predicted DNA-binding protein (MmcQ/YjbR family)
MDHMEWQETRDLVAGTIFLCIDESQRDHVCDCLGDPEQIWDQLKELHQQCKPGPHFNAYNTFFNL